MSSLLNSALAPIPTPLATLHNQSGAQLGTWFGCSLPDHFGDWLAEYRYLRESVALLDKDYRAYLDFTGPDRVRYLNAILTNNIKDLRENHGVISLFLNPQGRILAEIETYDLPDKLFCVSYASIREPLVAALDKYIIMDDVTLTDRTDDFATLALEGPKAALVAEELTGVDPADLAELETRLVSVQRIPCRLGKRSPGGTASAEFLVDRAHSESIWNILVEAARKHGGGPVGYQALSSTRLEQGIPWFSYDFGEKQIPHEAGLQDSHISYTKGCYTGQEIVERVRSRGQVNRVRVTLKFNAPQPPAPGTTLLSEGKEAGSTTRAAFSPALNAPIGMAYLRREKSHPGSVLELPDAAGSATVIATPIP
ncbi:MAG TPA: glycine cleavage T C-terminal barrel domain-containing protein [Candidatus Sulfotelmatobacter sp.]|jgi:folate-binding protein YgfZ|nr:glycine cleavage T C-terminal barrel domain-containing protein [Candidatus Sulfotelmatobacter sp.]